jgi:hypothetical protein
MATNPYSFYLDVLSKWETSPSIESLFYVVFHFPTSHIVKSSLGDWTNYWEGYPGGYTGTTNASWNIDQNVIDMLLNPTNQDSTDSLIGCVFVREATIPMDKIEASNKGLSYASYQAPVVSDARTPYGKVSLSFMETNASFVDFVIRPWLVLTGYYGLVTRPNLKVKCDSMDIIYLSKNGNKNRINSRKIIRFYGVIPTNIGNLKNSLSVDGMQSYTVDFAFDKYAVIDPLAVTNPVQITKPTPVENPLQYNLPVTSSPSNNPLQFNQPAAITNPLQFNPK